MRNIWINGDSQYRVYSPLLRILSSSTSVCPLGIFLLKTWAERRNMASTAEPFNSAIWSSRSRDRKPASTEQLGLSFQFLFFLFFKFCVKPFKFFAAHTWNILGKLHQNLNLTCRHFRQQEKVFFCAVLVLKLETSICNFFTAKKSLHCSSCEAFRMTWADT